MKTNLSVADPLAEQAVTIIVTLAADSQPRDERPIMVSLGVAAQSPIIQTGTLDQLPLLIDQAWTAFGVQAQVNKAGREDNPAAEEQIVAAAQTDTDQVTPGSDTSLNTPKPKASNLSLF